MKFKKKEHQQVIEVLAYDNGPKCYGFYQEKHFYLALYLSEKSDKETWLHVLLKNSDKVSYEKLKEGELSLKDFLQHKQVYLVDWDSNGKQIFEKELTKVLDTDIPRYHLEVI